MKTRIFIVLTVLLTTVSCQVQEWPEEQNSMMTFYAVGEPATRTSLLQDYWWHHAVVWSPSDEISVFCKKGGGKFVSTNTEVTNGTATFVGSLENVLDREETDLYWAVHPFSEGNTFDGNAVGLTLPSEQKAVLGNVDDDLMVSIARSGDKNLYFYNLCGIISIPVYEKGIKKIVFKGNNGEYLAGKVKASFDESGDPFISEWKDPVSEITLLPPGGGTFEVNGMYDVVSFPGYFEKGYTIEFYREELVSMKQIHTPVSLPRAKFVDLTNLYTGGTIYSVEHEGKKYSLEYAHEGDSTYYWVKIDEKVFEIPERFSAQTDENPTCMGPAVAINTDTETIYFAMGMVDYRDYTDSDEKYYSYHDGVIYRITSSGIEKYNHVIEGYPSFSMNEKRNTLELHSYYYSYYERIYRQSLFEKMSFNHWAEPNFGEQWNWRLDYEQTGFNNKTLPDVIFLFQEKIPDYPDSMTAVDLGLSVKWSSCNLGALTPEMYGDRYAWGEITTKDSYTPENYLYGGGTKYNPQDEKFFLDSEDDAAHVQLGEDWRIPSSEEWLELIDNCSWQWVYLRGAIGVLGTSLKNGNCIFLPVDNSQDQDVSGEYLSSEIDDGYGEYWSCAVPCPSEYNYDEHTILPDRYMNERYLGSAIRPVFGHISVEDISLDHDRIELGVGESFQLNATITPANASDKTVLWSSSDESVARVSPTGWVVADAEGETIITATTPDGGKTASCHLTVRKNSPSAPEAVNLGLSVKWASFNLGATKPEEYGDYYAWGETEPKADYSWATYKWCMGSKNTLTKYCTRSEYGYNGFTDEKTVLDPEDDAAHVILGGNWRMPTKEEQDELRNKCSWEWTQVNGVNGQMVTGPNGNSIFLPAACDPSLVYPEYVDSYGGYWSCSLYTSDPDFESYQILFFPYGTGWSYNDRFFGFSVRPVSE